MAKRQEGASPNPALSKRERQVMDVIYARGGATVNQILEDMQEAPSRSAVRTFLSILERKGHLRHKKAGKEYFYQPVRARRTAGRSALKRVLDVFFNGSLEDAVTAHLLEGRTDVPADELKRLSKLIDAARKKGR